MKEIINKLLKLLNKTSTPAEPIPAEVLLVGANLRPGLSAREMASEIIAKQSEAGAPFGNVFDGSNNVMEQMEVIRCQVIIDHLLTKSKIEISIPQGIPVTTTGANSGGPVVSTGATTKTAKGVGVIR